MSECNFFIDALLKSYEKSKKVKIISSEKNVPKILKRDGILNVITTSENLNIVNIDKIKKNIKIKKIGLIELLIRNQIQ